jgi:hypothetical protein
MALVKQSTARNRMVFMTDETDHVSGLPGLTLTITASKNGAAFASISPTVTDRGDGWYNLAYTTSHSDTLGDLALHITATGADPLDLLDEVVVKLPGEAADEWTAVIADSVAALNSRPTPLQALLMMTRFLMTARDSVGGLLTVYKEDGATPSMTFDQNSTSSVTRYERAS